MKERIKLAALKLAVLKLAVLKYKNYSPSSIDLNITVCVFADGLI